MESISTKLKQHILAAKQNWETVRKSADLPDEIVRLLERRGKDAPFVSQGGDFGLPTDAPPIVRRGFPLGNGDWAVSSFRDIGASLTRERGNYLAHTLIVPENIVRQHRYNIPWIGYQLAQQATDPMRKRPSEIYDLHNKGAEEMEDVEVVLDPDGQFRALAFAADEMGMTELNALFQRLLAQAASGSPLDLAMPAPNVERVVEANKKYLEGIEAEGKIPGDRVRVLRLAGMYSILPDALKIALPYAINQPKPLAQARRGEELDYGIRVPREPLLVRDSLPRQSIPPMIEQGAWPWLEYCVKLAQDCVDLAQESTPSLAQESTPLPAQESTPLPEKESAPLPEKERPPLPEKERPPLEHRQLIGLTEWLSGLLSKNEFASSRRAIDAGFAFWSQYSGVGREKRPPSPPLSLFEGLRVNIDFLFKETSIATSDWEKRCKYCFQLCNLADKGSIELPPAAFKEVLVCFRFLCTNRHVEDLRLFCSIFPKSLHAQLWEQSYRDGLLPGKMRASGDLRIDQILLEFALRNYDPSHITSTEIAGKITDDIKHALSVWRCGRGSQMQSGNLGAPSDSERQKWIIAGLVTMNEVNSDVLESLVQNYLSVLLGPSSRVGYPFPASNDQFSSIVSGPLTSLLNETTIGKLGGIGADVLARILNAVRTRQDIDAFRALLEMRLQVEMLPNLIRVLDRLDTFFIDSPSQQSLTAAASKLLREIADVTKDTLLLESFGTHNEVLPVFRKWVDDPLTFHWVIPKVLQLIGYVFFYLKNQPETIVAVGSTYLQYCPTMGNTRVLFEFVYRVLDNDTKKIRAWLEQNPIRSRFLLRLLCSETSYGEKRAELCWREVVRVLFLLPPECQQEIRSHLQNSKSLKTLPKTVRKMIEGQWLAPQAEVMLDDRGTIGNI